MAEPGNAAEAAKVRSNATEVFEPGVVSAAYDRLAEAIERDYRDRDPVLLAVMCGGMVPAAALMQRFDFPFRLDYVHATRYGTATRGGELTWRVPPSQSLRGETVLIVDDILDHGTTLAALKARLSAIGVLEQRVAVLVQRDRNQAASVVADYVGLRAGPGFLFGCGMDVAGYWRGLASISVMRDQ